MNLIIIVAKNKIFKADKRNYEVSRVYRQQEKNSVVFAFEMITEILLGMRDVTNLTICVLERCQSFAIMGAIYLKIFFVRKKKAVLKYDIPDSLHLRQKK